jgi:GrpB-like predicted nucleotidyltransferase (UPF0157 family)
VETVATEPVAIVEYDPSWPRRFDEASTELSAVLRGRAVRIEHVGSTAVPGLAAKPIIDIQVEVDTLLDADLVPAIEGLGYEYVPDYEAEFPRRRYFRRNDPDGRRTHHVHVVEHSDRAWSERHIAFRDWLRRHDDDRDRYAALKRRLADEFGANRAGYTDAKTAFIHQIEQATRNDAP